MKRKYFFIAVLSMMLVVMFVFLYNWAYTEKRNTIVKQLSVNKRMQLSSPAFSNNSYIPLKYSCDGENVNPPLTISGVPENAKSLVLIVDDPDASSGLFIHWILYNIDPTITAIAENSVPKGALEGTTSFGRSSYGGPCPPSGLHHYQFHLYALNNKLEGLYNPDKSELEQVMQVHVIDKTELVGLFTR